MREHAQLLQIRADGLLVDLRILGRPVVLVAQTPQQNAGMVVVLRDHVAQRAAAHLLEDVVAHAAAAPGNLLPHQDAEPVAVLEHTPRLLVVPQPNEICAHVFDELHLLLEQFIRHRRRIACVVFVAAGPAQQQTLSIQLERPMFDELGVADAECLMRDISGVCSQRHTALIKMRVGRAPQLRRGHGEAGDLHRTLPGLHHLFCAVNQCSLRVRHLNGDFERIGRTRRVV